MLKSAPGTLLKKFSAAPPFLSLPKSLSVVSGRGSRVTDSSGKQLIDCLAFDRPLGHNHPRIAKVLGENATKLGQKLTDEDLAEIGKLPELLAKLMKQETCEVFGSAEEAFRHAMLYIFEWGIQRKKVPQGSGSLVILGESSLNRKRVNGSGLFGPFWNRLVELPQVDPRKLEILLENIPEIVAVLIEPASLGGELGQISAETLREVGRICHERNALFVLDETYCGFGREGTFSPYASFDFSADLSFSGASLANGVLPFSAVSGKKTIIDCFQPVAKPLLERVNPLPFFIATEVAKILNEIEVTGSIQRNSATLKESLDRAFARKTCKFAGVARGLLAEIKPKDSKVESRDRLVKELIASGVCPAVKGDFSVVLAPPINISEAETSQLGQAVEKAIANSQ